MFYMVDIYSRPFKGALLGPGIDPEFLLACVWGFMRSLWVSFRFSGVFPQSKNMPIGLATLDWYDECV